AAKDEITGLIIDLRGTQGGDATQVLAMLRSLVGKSTFYEMPGVWDSELETYLTETEATVTIEPEEPVYTGPIVLLVDPYTMGPSESLAGFLAKLENVHVFGDGGTAGSPGVPSVELTL